MSRSQARIAVHRFGFGPAGDDLKKIGGDPRGWLLEQLTGPAGIPLEMKDLPPSSENVLDWWDAVVISVAELVKRIRSDYQQLWRREAAARLAAAVSTRQPFRERLVWFWGNHFTCSANKPVVVGMAGGHEREAIRPRVTGQFYDMALAAISHPGMLFYLDNYRSVGSQSSVSVYGGRGLNENLAREILELHTLGVDGGYIQEDVREFAKALTGWTFGRRYSAEPGGFLFRADYHEPGDKTVRGVNYPEAGVEEGRAVLKAVSRDPATARHVAFRFAQHFIADDPPEPLVSTLARRFLETDGDLADLAQTLIQQPEAWSMPLSKLKTPQEYGVALYRALGVEPDLDQFMQVLTGFGHLPFMAPSPAGWPDTEKDWLSPDAALRRARFAFAVTKSSVATQVSGGQTASDYFRQVSATIGETANTTSEIPDVVSELAVRLASPQFQRR